MKVISMTDFVINYKYDDNEPMHSQDGDRLNGIIKYANFLKKPLELGMFIPCDEDGKPIEEPVFPTENRKAYDGLAELFEWELKQYQQAKERVLFEGDIEYKNGMLILGNCELHYNTEIFSTNNIEWLIQIITYNKFDLTLTDNAIKNFNQ